MSPRLTLSFLIYSIILMVLCYLANPHFYYFNKDYKEIITRPSIAPPTQFKSLESSCVATAQYRYTEDRTGVAPSSYNPTSQVKIEKHIFPLNVGIHSASKSSPTIDDTGVYVGSDTGWFWKMNHNGEKIWEFYIPNSGNGIHGSAAVDDKKVFIGAYNGFLYALDKMSGELIWANPVGDYIGASPLLANGAVFISAETGHPDGLIAKVDCNTGKTIWVSQWLGGHSHSSPTFDKKNMQILAGANSGRFYAFNEEDGTTNWAAQLKGQVKGTAMIHEGIAYFGSWDKHYHAVDTKTGKTLWSKFMGGRIQTSLTKVPGKNMGVTNTKRGEIIGIHLKTSEILWRLKHGDPNHQFSILVTHNKSSKTPFLAWSRCKEYQLCILDAITGKLIKNIDLPGPFTSVPFAYQNKVYITLDGNNGMVILE